MELIPTLSQSGALYLAHKKIVKRRLAFFQRATEDAFLVPPDIYRRTFADAHASRRFHADNGC